MRPQFGLAALLSLTACIGIVLSYLRQFDEIVFVQSASCILSAVVIGAVVGVVSKRIRDTMYWAVLGALFVLISAAGRDMLHPLFLFGWSLVGAVVGSCTAAATPGKPIRSGFIGAVLGTLILSGFSIATVGVELAAVFEIACATLAGSLLAISIELMFWFERRTRIPRHVTAAFLLLCVVVVNVLGTLYVHGL